MIKKLTLIDVKKVTFKDLAEKMKHLFVDETQKPFTGWTDLGEELPKELIELSGLFNTARARDYNVDVNEFDGKMRYKVDCNPQRSSST